TLFIPNTLEEDPAVVYQVITLRNESSSTRPLHVTAFANLRGATPEDVEGCFDKELGALLAWNTSQTDWVRVLGFSEPAADYMTTHDVSRADDPVSASELTRQVRAKGSLFGVVEVGVDLAPGEAKRLAVVLAFSPRGSAEARRIFSEARDFEKALDLTLDHYQEVLDISRMETPDPVINQGVQWSKANMRRVMGTYPVSRAFTNEPGVSSNVVIRDVAWFVHGNDWMEPKFSREILRTTSRMRYPNGKIAEYFSALDGHIEDYGLNINDDTPLFILAVGHHCFATGDKDLVEELLPAVEGAARYILSQRDDRGLVFCSARGQNVWGIASWRNVIPNYSINGAVTEINSLCYAALMVSARLAAYRGSKDMAEELEAEAGKLREAINTHLLNPRNGLYYLNIDVDGGHHTDVTSDQVFPVMFGVAPDDVAFRIISRLNSPDFWTEAGLRVVSDQSPYYDPSTQVGLMGGVWPGVVFWYAFAAAKYHPEFMVRGLHQGYRSYLQAPRKNNTVPGQFSEWFDGASLVNRGMRLSPWEPPRYLWAAIEGLGGVLTSPEGVKVDPRLPPSWKWLSLSRLPCLGRELSFFVAREGRDLRLYASEKVESPWPVTVCGEDMTKHLEDWSADATLLAFQRDGCITVCLGNSANRTLVVPWSLRGLLKPDRRYRARTYNSEFGGWVDSGESFGRDLRGLAVSVEQNGFYILTLEELSK
ncbi:MAG TPA: hypothetical protein VGN26_01740, partial [Armatimonadota bacterium]